MNPNIETFIGCDCPFEMADIVLFGAPFDSTTSFRPGARFGSSAMRHESFGLETYSPYQDKDLTDCRVFDSGDLELCFGSAEAALHDIEARAEEILSAGKLPLLLGGEHLVTLGSVRAVHKRHPEMHIIHFDAHADLRDDYLGAKLSHACVIRRCHELVGDGHIHQFCIRSGDREEFRFAKDHTDLHPFCFDGLDTLTEALARSGAPVYFTIDLDCLDPSAFPGTGTPEAGGVTFPQLLEAIRMVARTNVVGADVNELAPMLDPSGVSTAAACKVLRELLLALSE
ncbi:agmatinase [Flavonifractor hominis]|uniref:Agmatinase n=1 Tax=Flavonifractor hominis TaxID=3133178 RepID=A0ABV1ERN9_9FIRM